MKFHELNLDFTSITTKNEEERLYFDLHGSRLKFTINMIAKVLQNATLEKQLTLLDVGPHFLTQIIKREFKDRISIDTLGYRNDGVCPIENINKHFEFDLNTLQENGEKTPALPNRYNIIVLAEVIEHLHVSPIIVLKSLWNILRDGGILFISTPNGVYFTKRIQMLFGKNPFEMIRQTPKNPGHFREYTGTELKEIARTAGYNSCSVQYIDLYPHNFLVSIITSAIPGTRQTLFATCIK
jgi:predicted SAM-dependent methyltransferase